MTVGPSGWPVTVSPQMLLDRIETIERVDAAPDEAVSAVEPSREPREPISPELTLVLPPEEARLARAKLPDPESLDDWLFRMRWEETERALREFLADAQARHERVELMRSRAVGAAFAAACAALSLLPVLGFVLGA